MSTSSPTCPWLMPFAITRTDGIVLVHLSEIAAEHPWMRRDDALAWTCDAGIGRVVIDCDELRMVSSTLLGWLLRLVDRVGAGAVELRRLAPALARQLRQFGIDRLTVFAT